MFTTESPTTIEEKLSSGLKKIENMHASVTEYPIHSIDMECEIGHYHEYYGVEYFAQHGLDAKSSPVKILQWMKQNNIDFHPHFNDSIIGRENNAYAHMKENDLTFVQLRNAEDLCETKLAEQDLQTIVAPDETKLAVHKRLYDEAKSKGYDFSYIVEITSNGYLRYMMYLIVKRTNFKTFKTLYE